MVDSAVDDTFSPVLNNPVSTIQYSFLGSGIFPNGPEQGSRGRQDLSRYLTSFVSLSDRRSDRLFLRSQVLFS